MGTLSRTKTGMAGLAVTQSRVVVRRVNPSSHRSTRCSRGVKDCTLQCGACGAAFRSERTYHCRDPSGHHLVCVYGHEGDAAFLSKRRRA